MGVDIKFYGNKASRGEDVLKKKCASLIISLYSNISIPNSKAQ